VISGQLSASTKRAKSEARPDRPGGLPAFSKRLYADLRVAAITWPHAPRAAASITGSGTPRGANSPAQI
jgi:hypothetical protein